MDLIVLHERTVAEFVARVAAVPAEAWGNATPCTEWDARELVNHVVGEDRWTAPLLEGATIAEVGDRFDGDLLGDDPATAARDAAAEAVAARGRARARRAGRSTCRTATRTWPSTSTSSPPITSSTPGTSPRRREATRRSTRSWSPRWRRGSPIGRSCTGPGASPARGWRRPATTRWSASSPPSAATPAGRTGLGAEFPTASAPNRSEHGGLTRSTPGLAEAQGTAESSELRASEVMLELAFVGRTFDTRAVGFNNPSWTWSELEAALSGKGRDGRAPGQPVVERRRRRAGVEPQAPAVRRRRASNADATGPVPYAELHCHSNFSFLDGASHPEELATEAARLGLEALALTDHDGFYGVVRFAEAARAVGMPTVFGAEITLTPGHRPPTSRSSGTRTRR